MEPVIPDEKYVPRYYEAMGRAHDYLMRCKDCKKLTTFQVLSKNGCCACCNRKFSEITTLSLWEWLKIRLGIIQFTDRDKFLKEFSRG